MAEAKVVWLSAQHELTDYEMHSLRKRKCWFSRYMGSRDVCSKRTFFGILNCAKTIFPEKFNRFVPKTWFFPEDKSKLLHEIQRNQDKQEDMPEHILPTFIAKPSKGYGGFGIKLIQREEDIPGGTNDLVL